MLPFLKLFESVDDMAYLKAVRSGDVASAQRMVDDAAKKAGIPTIGVNINDSTQPFTDQILSGEKTIETRSSRNNAFSRLVGERIAIVRTGRGVATIVGYATVGDPIEYLSRQHFDSDFEKHRVAGGDYGFSGYKIGYPLIDVQRVKSYPAPPATGVIKTRPIHSLVIRDERGEIIPLSQRFPDSGDRNRY